MPELDMLELAGLAGLLCAAISFVVQLAAIWSGLSVPAKEEMEHASKEASGAALLFLLFAWIFSVSEWRSFGLSSFVSISFVLWIISFLSVVLFAMWAAAPIFRRQMDETERKLYARMRFFCLIYAAAGFAAGFLVR